MAEPTKFLSIPDSILKNPKLSATSKLLYGVLRYHQYDKTCCWPSIPTLCKVMGGTSRAAVSRAVKQLKTAGLVAVAKGYSRSNRYTVKVVRDRTFLRVRLDIVRLPSLLPIDKLLTASIKYKSNNADSYAYPFQDRLAAELGCSLSTICRALARLEAAKNIEVDHRGGGRKRGNYYRITDGFYRLVLTHDQRESTSKRGAKHKPLEFKRTIETQKLPFKDLSETFTQDQAYSLLLRFGVHRKVAWPIVYDQKTPPESVRNAVQNALSRKAWLKLTDPFRANHFKTAGYIIASLNKARSETHLVRPSIRNLNIEKLKTPYKPLSKEDFEKRRQEQLQRLLVG